MWGEPGLVQVEPDPVVLHGELDLLPDPDEGHADASRPGVPHGVEEALLGDSEQGQLDLRVEPILAVARVKVNGRLRGLFGLGLQGAEGH